MKSISHPLDVSLTPTLALPQVIPAPVPAKRYSSLTEINSSNVKTLKPIVTFSLDVNKGQEPAPIVVDNTTYIVTAYPN
jgi:glucose dehydrogenase